eukprot:487286-Rhodomonas_salina.3
MGTQCVGGEKVQSPPHVDVKIRGASTENRAPELLARNPSCGVGPGVCATRRPCAPVGPKVGAVDALRHVCLRPRALDGTHARVRARARSCPVPRLARHLVHGPVRHRVGSLDSVGIVCERLARQAKAAAAHRGRACRLGREIAVPAYAVDLGLAVGAVLDHEASVALDRDRLAVHDLREARELHLLPPDHEHAVERRAGRRALHCLARRSHRVVARGQTRHVRRPRGCSRVAVDAEASGAGHESRRAELHRRVGRHDAVGDRAERGAGDREAGERVGGRSVQLLPDAAEALDSVGLWRIARCKTRRQRPCSEACLARHRHHLAMDRRRRALGGD